MVFDFASAPLLPLVGHKLATAYPAHAMALMSARIIAAQSIMLPIARAVGCRPILLPGLPALGVRVVLYILSDDTAWLIGPQL